MTSIIDLATNKALWDKHLGAYTNYDDCSHEQRIDALWDNFADDFADEFTSVETLEQITSLLPSRCIQACQEDAPIAVFNHWVYKLRMSVPVSIAEKLLEQLGSPVEEKLSQEQLNAQLLWFATNPKRYGNLLRFDP